MFFIGPYLKHVERLFDRWNNLEQALKSRDVQKRPDGSFFTYLARGLFPVNWDLAWRLYAEIGFMRRVLDVGCGSCVWSLPFAMHNASVVGLDFKEVIESAARFTVEKLGLRKRYEFIEGNMFNVNWGGNYNLVIMGQILHSHSPDQVLEIFTKSKDAIGSGGFVAVIEFFKGYGRGPTLFDINMLLNTTRGRVYSVSDLEEIAKRASLKPHKFVLLDPSRGVGALILV